MLENPMKAALARGDVLIGTWINMVRNPAILTLLKSAGLDYVRVDMEHTAIDIESVGNMALLARALGFPITVRPPDGNREWITRLLDAGVWSLHIPQVDTPDQARSVAKAARYAPAGERGMIGVGPGTDFDSASDPLEGLAFANEQIHVTVMLESRQAFDHLDEIASTPGIDALTLGPSDLAQDLGVFGSADQARVLDEHRERLLEACVRHGKDCAMRVDSVEQARHWGSKGARLLGFSSEVAVLRSAYRDAVAAMRKA